MRQTTIPGWRKVFFRPKTSDLATFREIFVNGEYDVRRHKSLPLLVSHYDAIRKAGRRPLIVDAGANIGLATVFSWMAVLRLMTIPPLSRYSISGVLPRNPQAVQQL